jgi:peptidoglycan hydrolase-like protein with peptidoglycan-binding domain
MSKTIAGLVCLTILLSLHGWAATSKTTNTGKSATSKKTVSVSKKRSKSKRLRARKGSWKRRGQQTIASGRTTEIQEALIRHGYLGGEPSGVMDGNTKAALVKLQQENGWQTRIVPDSRALIKLGLGPKHDNLINPNTAAYSTAADMNGSGAASQR